MKELQASAPPAAFMPLLSYPPAKEKQPGKEEVSWHGLQEMLATGPHPHPYRAITQMTTGPRFLKTWGWFSRPPR